MRLAHNLALATRVHQGTATCSRARPRWDRGDDGQRMARPTVDPSTLGRIIPVPSRTPLDAVENRLSETVTGQVSEVAPTSMEH